MRSLIITVTLLISLGFGSSSGAADELLGLEVGLRNFADGMFFNNIVSELDYSGGSTRLFTDAREKVEKALHRHANLFLGLSPEQQAAFIKKLMSLSYSAKPASLAFPNDRVRAEVYGMLLQWRKGRLEGVIDYYTAVHLKEIEEQKLIQARLLQAELKYDQGTPSNPVRLPADPGWNR